MILNIAQMEIYQRCNRLRFAADNQSNLIAMLTKSPLAIAMFFREREKKRKREKEEKEPKNSTVELILQSQRHMFRQRNAYIMSTQLKTIIVAEGNHIK